ncbi:MAG: mechanosensitive ion channel family protein [Candidatus Nanohaloarchaeota archaeon QJJ-5]|nr:mechanosensitive ion channel family protein [Candidatus Nanohaloarchaeota archaeon QJJ-5]
MKSIPEWVNDPATVLAVTIAFYVVGKLIVKPLSVTLISRKNELLAPSAGSMLFALTVVIGLISGLTAAGYQETLSILGAVAAGGTFAIGFAMRDTLSAFVAGIFILLDKPFTQGDWIEWGDRTGRVKEINIRTTRVETFNSEMLTVPNNELSTNTIKNPVANNHLRGTTMIGIGYDDDIEEAKEIILDILTDIDMVADDPEPAVVLTDLNESDIGLQARYWLEDPTRGKYVKTRETLLQQVKERFEEAGIDIPYPTRTIAGDSLTVDR